MIKPYVVSVECMIIVYAEDSDSAADIARSELEEIAFDVIVNDSKEY